ncbi:hypothetical protein MHYP_G00072120 [Metynnis hypsauchen]
MLVLSSPCSHAVTQLSIVRSAGVINHTLEMCTFPVLHTNKQNKTNSISLPFFRVYERPHVRPDTEGRLTVEPSCYPLQTSCPRPSYPPWTSAHPTLKFLMDF